MNDLFKMKNNCIQNFYIIGLSPNDFFQHESKGEKEIKLVNILTSNTEMELIPKIITKYPPTDSNFNSIPNDIIIDHCFPRGFKMQKSLKKIETKTYFCFELDNLKYNYLFQKKFLYSKIYFSCLKFYEPLENYEKFELELDKKDNEQNNKNIINDNTKNDKYFYYIPKVICFANLLPFTKEFYKLLDYIYDSFLYYNKNIEQYDTNNLGPPLEKIIEKIVMTLPFPLSTTKETIISYKFNFPLNSNQNILKKNPNETCPNNESKINIQKYEPFYFFMNNEHSLFLINLFSFFSEEEVIKIFKYIILEVPILFFSDNIELLSQIIQGFLSLTQPFTYVQPHTTILPSKFYGIINAESRFIFGIAENYSPNFFKNNNILLDKSIIVVHFLNQKGKIEEPKKSEEQKDYVIIDNYNIFHYINNDPFLPNDPISLDFPIAPKKKLLNNLKSLVSESKKKKNTNNNNPDELELMFNQQIRNLFFMFLTKILKGYTDYLLRTNNYNINKDKKTENFNGDSILYKINYTNNMNDNSQNSQILFIKSIFSMDEFIARFPKENHIFYRAFFNTKLFHNFIREIVFSTDEQICLKHQLFDLFTHIKQHKELKKNENYRGFWQKAKNICYSNKKIGNKKTEKEPIISEASKEIINISNDSVFNLDEKKILSNKNNQKKALTNYYQLINNIDNLNNSTDENISEQQILIKYPIFPKLLFDNQFFDIAYEKLFYRHYLEIPNQRIIERFYKDLKEINQTNFDKYKDILIPKNKMESDLNVQSNDNATLHKNTILVKNYIEFNWLLLISFSLWYCNDIIETEIRINKIFDVLDKMEVIEEQVLIYLYLAIYNFGNKSQFIKMFEYLNRFMGYSPYICFIFLCLKVSQKEDDESESKNDKIISDNKENYLENKNNDKKKETSINLKIRSFMDLNKYKEDDNKERDNIIYEETSKEKNKKNISSDLIRNISNTKEEITFYTIQQCKKCKKENKILNNYELIHNRMNQKNEHIYYKCKECGEKNEDVKLEYYLSLINKKKNESIVIFQGQFNLIPPNKIYQQIKEYFIYLNDYKLDIDHIFSNDKICLLNNIFYFTSKSLPFDFLIPYQNQVDRDYFSELEDEEEIENNNENMQKYSINKDNFSLK